MKSREKIRTKRLLLWMGILASLAIQSRQSRVEQLSGTYLKIMPYQENLPYKFIAGGVETKVIKTEAGLQQFDSGVDSECIDMHVTEDKRFLIMVKRKDTKLEFKMYRIEQEYDQFIDLSSVTTKQITHGNYPDLNYNGLFVDYLLENPRFRRIAFKFENIAIYFTIDTQSQVIIRNSAANYYHEIIGDLEVETKSLAHIRGTIFNVYMVLDGRKGEPKLTAIYYETDQLVQSMDSNLVINPSYLGYESTFYDGSTMAFMFHHEIMTDFLVFSIDNTVFMNDFYFEEDTLSLGQREKAYDFITMAEQDLTKGIVPIKNTGYFVALRSEARGGDLFEQRISICILYALQDVDNILDIGCEKQAQFDSEFGSLGLTVMPSGAMYSLSSHSQGVYRLEHGLNDFCYIKRQDIAYLGGDASNQDRILPTKEFIDQNVDCSQASTISSNCEIPKIFSNDCLRCELGKPCSVKCAREIEFYDEAARVCKGCSERPHCKSCRVNSNQCEACFEGYFLRNGQCEETLEEKCQEGEMYNSKENKCDPCSAVSEGCSKCSSADGPVCQGCQEGRYLDQQSQCQTCPGGCSSCSNQGVCEDQKTELKYYLRYEPKKPYLTFAMILLDSNNKVVNGLPPIVQMGSSKNIFEFSSKGTMLPSFTTRTTNGGYEVKVELTEEAYKSNGQGELDLIVGPKEGAEISKDYKFAPSPIKIARIPAKNPSEKSEKMAVAEGPVSNVVAGVGSSAVAPAVIAPISTFDPSGAMLMSGQFVSLTKRFSFINIDFGNSFNAFLRNTAEINPEAKNEEGSRIMQGTRGKFDEFGVSKNFESALKVKTIIYLVSYSLGVVVWGILLMMKIRKKISIWGFKVIKILRKIHFVVFGVSIMDVYFFGLRFVFHQKSNVRSVAGKLFVGLAMVLMTLDILKLIGTVQKIISREDTEEGDQEKLNESREDLNEESLEEEEEDNTPPENRLSMFSILALLSRGVFHHPEVKRAMREMRKNNQGSHKRVRVIDFERTYRYISGTNTAMVEYIQGGLVPGKHYTGNSKVPYFTNIAFTLRLLSFQILIISLSYLPGLQVCMMTLLEVAYLIFNLLCYIRFRHFKNFAIFLSKIFQSLFIILLFVVFFVINLKNAKIETTFIGEISNGIQNFGIYLIILAVLIEYFFTFLNLFITIFFQIRKMTKKRKLGENSKKKKKEIEGFVYKWILEEDADFRQKKMEAEMMARRRERERNIRRQRERSMRQGRRNRRNRNRVRLT